MKKVLLGALTGVLIAIIGGCDIEATDNVLIWTPIEAEAQQEYTAREFSYSDAQILLRVATAEAESEHNEGMFKVMNVVLNRVNSPNYPDTIEDVVFYPNAFTTVANGRYSAVEISPQAHEALARLEKGEPIDPEIVAFDVNDGNNKLSEYFEFKYTVGRHNFYKERGGKR